jgi:hypothetical protein
VHDERGKEVPFQTEVRVAMSEPLNNQPRNLAVTGPGNAPALSPSGGTTAPSGGTTSTSGTTSTTAGQAGAVSR